MYSKIVLDFCGVLIAFLCDSSTRSLGPPYHYSGLVKILDHAMPREKEAELRTAVSGLLARISRAYRNFTLWHHEFINATRSAALVVLH